MKMTHPWKMASSAIAILMVCGGAAFAADISPDQQSRQIDQLLDTVKSQQKQIDQLVNQLQELKSQTAASAALAGQAPSSDGVKSGASGLAAAPVTVPNPVPPAGVPSYFSDAGSFLIPGTRTTMKVGGFAKLDVSYDVNGGLGAPGAQSLGINSAASATGKAGFALPYTQAAHETGRFQESARSSRLIMQTNTPTEMGPVKFFMEADFQGGGTGNSSSSNSAPLRFRQAYGTLGGWTFGETYTLWTDRATLPGSVDINAGAGIDGGIRGPVAQYRWDLDAGQKNQLYFGIENPFNDYLGADTETFTTAATPQPTNNTTKMPDLTVRYANNSSAGRFFITGLLRDLEANDAGSIDTAYALGTKKISVHSNTFGWGVNIGGKAYTGLGNPLNNVTFRVLGGEGIARYFNAGGGYSAVIDNSGNLKTVPIAGYNLAYQHWFTDKWQANAIFGQQHVWYPNALIGPTNTQGLQKNLSELELNLIWFPYPWVQVGPAYYYATTDVVAPYVINTNSSNAVPGTTRTTSGTSAHDNRLQFTTTIGF